jgi:hypothetical protein
LRAYLQVEGAFIRRREYRRVLEKEEHSEGGAFSHDLSDEELVIMFGESTSNAK